MSDELANMIIRLETWQQAMCDIQRKYERGWALQSIGLSRAELAVRDAWQLSDDLRSLADHIERQAEQATAILKSDDDEDQ